MNPLRVWLFKECYLRFSPIKFDLSKFQNLFIHLTNYSITKKYTGNQQQQQQEEEIEENMWFLKEFQDYTKRKLGVDVWAERVYPKLKEIIVASLQCVQTRILHRKNSFELFGYDFMIDEEGHDPWLLEVNKFPTLEHSTHVTSDLVPRLMRDMCRLVIDGVEQQADVTECGDFELIHSGEELNTKPNHSVSLPVVGTRLL